jgi:hypothetical protein
MGIQKIYRDTVFTCGYTAGVNSKLFCLMPAKRFLTFGLLLFVLSVVTACSQQSQDKEIKADIVTKVKTDINFAGVSYTVDRGMVTLTGFCSTDKSKKEAEKTIKAINIIKGINNQIQIAPVVITADMPLKQSVDSVLAAYPTIQADVLANVITLKGKAQRQETDKLMSAINMLNPAKVENQLIIQ